MTRLWRGIHRVALFSAEDCARMVDLALGLEGWSDAKVRVGGDPAVRRSTRRARQLPVAGERSESGPREHFAPYLAAVEARVRELDASYFRVGVTGVRDAQLVDYEPGGFYAWHRDARDPRFRKLTALCYLTDRRSHGLVGGETSFAPPSLGWLMRHRRLRRSGARWLRWLPTVQAPRAGSAVVFDATLRHRAHRVRRGRKLALNVWFA